MIRTLALICLATPALADVDGVLDHHILPRIDRFAETATALADTSCDAPALRQGFADAAQAWAGISHLNMGPIQDGGRAKSVLFWPDDRDATTRGLRLLQAQGSDALTPEAMAQASVAARGLGALERQIFDNDAQPCDLTLALADDLAVTAGDIRDGWQDDFADQLRDPGQDGHVRFLTLDEVNQTLFTSLLAGMEYLSDQRLGRPLGSFDKPQPLRAELRRSQQSVPMIQTQIASLRELAAILGDAPLTDAAMARAQDQASSLDDPALSNVDDPSERFRVEAVQTTIKEAMTLAQDELGKALNVKMGFNAADGD
jgi:predicted lipoprotein